MRPFWTSLPLIATLLATACAPAALPELEPTFTSVVEPHAAPTEAPAQLPEPSGSPEPDGDTPTSSDGSGPAPAGPGVITTFVFRVRNLPAALYKALGGFATNGVNMTKLESYMIDGQFTATQFYADVEGHPDDPALARALDELGYFTSMLQILGVYPANPFRAKALAGQ